MSAAANNPANTWENLYSPYCLMCSTMGRMTRTSYGWVCEGEGDHFGRKGCGNKIDKNFLHYAEPTK